MADDDDWETDPDYKNDLTEEQQRAFGNREAMEKYNQAMGRQDTEGAIGQMKVQVVPLAPERKAAGEVVEGDEAVAPLGLKGDDSLRSDGSAQGGKVQPSSTFSPQLAVGENRRASALPLSKAASSFASPESVGLAEARRKSALTCGSEKSVLQRSKALPQEEMEKMRRLFDSFDADKSGHITVEELSTVLEQLGTPTAVEKVKLMLKESDADQSGNINFEEFLQAVDRSKTTASLTGFSEVLNRQTKTVFQVKKEQVVHSFDEEECAAFSDFINSKLGDDEALGYLLPIGQIEQLFECAKDGVLLCKLINVAVPETIDERVINVNPRNTFHVTENHNLALNAAKAVGLTVVNIGSQDLIEARPHLVLGLVWQMVKMALLSNINLKACPFLVRMLQPGEELETLLKLPPEKLLMRWVNYHLEQAGHPTRITNFGSDLKDSDVYCHLLKQIDPDRKASTAVLSNPDVLKRAAYVVEHGGRLQSEFTIQATDIVKGNEKLNLGFLAGLFNSCPGLDPPVEEELTFVARLSISDDDGGDSREERAFRMWLNSLGIETYVNNLYDDVHDGIVILQTMDLVRRGTVDWSKVNVGAKMVFKKTENLNYAVALAKSPFGFSLVGVQGKDIVDGNRKLTLALIWQLFREHLVSFLKSLRKAGGNLTPRGDGDLSDEAIVAWANGQVRDSGAPEKMRDLHDKSLASGLFLISLLAAVEPRCVDRAHVTAGATDEDKKLNAKYAISCARKLGCSLFLLWEDIVEVRPKMMLSFVASVMAHALAAQSAGS